MKTKIRRGRPTSYAFANNRHQRPLGTLLFPDPAREIMRLARSNQPHVTLEEAQAQARRCLTAKRRHDMAATK